MSARASTMNPTGPTPLTVAHQRHERRLDDFLYCYAVVSRRSKGLSVGINLNPDKACNFDCVYCQVDRTVPPVVHKVDLSILGAELNAIVDRVQDATLFQTAPFDAVPVGERVIRDFAFSGDGEPTTYPKFAGAIRIAANVRQARGLDDTKLVLITDACYLTRPEVRRGLAILDANHGEIWAKLDAGTEAYYQAVNRPNVPLAQVLENILDAARVRPIVIQSLWMRLHGAAPPDSEIDAFIGRLRDVLAAGGQIKLVQVYTIARRTTEAYATALSHSELNHIAGRVGGALPIPIETYYGIGDD